ncbi:DUF6769 family protein [Parabacteroides sp. Marseille-P3160]|uniref:DUF6769 family protein n=1 Tax=Parabacteroides sp. Marseille-P3160 TaxID=1917887 RepID=UPI0009BBA5D7|nr:DUF6769 family protein [Parabacteroides sp. Marseille-P3160]
MKKSFIAYALLVSSLFIPLSFLIPHHHHSDGTFCFSLSLVEEAEHEAEGHHESSQCPCSGQNQAVYTIIQTHLSGSIWLYPIPLEKFYSYAPPVFLLSKQALQWRQLHYIEFLHGVWIARATGLRAPPVSLL